MSSSGPDPALHRPAGHRAARADLLFTIALATVILAWLAVALTHLDFFSFEDDEGTFLVTAKAVWQGHKLYRDVWLNYFPGLIELLQLAFAVGGTTVISPRVLMAILAALGMLVSAVIARRAMGPLAGVATALLLALTPAMSRMGRSVMAEVPAAACTALGMYALQAHLHSGRSAWLIVAGLAAGFGVWFKYPAALALVVMFLALAVSARRRRQPWRVFAGRAVLLIGIASLPVLISSLTYDWSAEWQQILGTHVRSDAERSVNEIRNLGKFYGYLKVNNWGLATLAAAGLVALWRRRRDDAWLVGSWLGLYGLAMLLSTPLGTHHMYLFLAPLGILAGSGLAQLVELLFAARRPSFSRRCRHELAAYLLAALVLLVFLPSSVGQLVDLYRGDRESAAELYHAVDLVASMTQPNDYVLSDLPMITYRAGRFAPPWLTNTSGMRFEAGGLDEATVQAISTKYRPAAVVLFEDKLVENTPGYVAEIQASYVEVYRAYEPQDENYQRLHAIYVRPDRAQ